MNILIKRVDGGVSIMALAPTTTDADREVEKWKNIHPGQYVSHRAMAQGETMPPRTFRDAWTEINGTIDHDWAKAREIRKEQLRRERAPKLAELDTAFLRAIEAGDQAEGNKVAAKKQALRDVTADPRIAAATSVAALLEVRLP